MGRLFEEIDVQQSPLGEISLRRRRIPAIADRDIYEVKLNDEFLMSSMFVDAEVALADLGLAAAEGNQLGVVVGGLGLGYTAAAALDSERVAELLVVEALEPVIGWHKDGKVPLGGKISSDPRCRYIHGSFFELALTGFDPGKPGKQFEAILLDIDHSPSDHLNSANAGFYNAEKLAAMAKQLVAGGVFAMWSNDPPDESFIAVLSQVFRDVEAQVITFDNPFQNEPARNTVYLGRKYR
ncbi:spermidine synthase [Proteobacteria bacterium 005FR1]|nr:spermidine synthase [Proteobacteria bacterium 005FR1]